MIKLQLKWYVSKYHPNQKHFREFHQIFFLTIYLTFFLAIFQNEESNRELTEEGFSIEIIRALRGDCCEDLSSTHHETPAECIKHLKNLRWKHMQHIQDEFKKLCDLQKFLDEYSPRQSLPPFQSHSGAVEQRVEERQQQQQQQQHEEKQNLGTIS